MKKTSLFLGILTISTLMQASLQKFASNVTTTSHFLLRGTHQRVENGTRLSVGQEHNPYAANVSLQVLATNQTQSNQTDKHKKSLAKQYSSNGAFIYLTVFGGVIVCLTGPIAIIDACEKPIQQPHQDIELENLDVGLK